MIQSHRLDELLSQIRCAVYSILSLRYGQWKEITFLSGICLFAILDSRSLGTCSSLWLGTIALWSSSYTKSPIHCPLPTVPQMCGRINDIPPGHYWGAYRQAASWQPTCCKENDEPGWPCIAENATDACGCFHLFIYFPSVLKIRPFTSHVLQLDVEHIEG